ncbi:MAG: D-alanyl-D-alanine carboxypeptidase family protein [Bacillota bacterium]|jgi:D-alanyl-D-alanine carboxypeptidase
MRRSKRRSRGSVFRPVVALVLVLACWAISQGTGDEPKLVAEAAIALDMETGKVLFEKNAQAPMYPASLTKLMTALLLSEHREPVDALTYSARAWAQIPVKIDLRVGSNISAADAMDAMLIGSANDIAYMIAENLCGNEEAFAELMNARADSLGLNSTHFTNASGLHDDNHYSTASDLASLFREALRDPWIRKTMAKNTATLESARPSGPDPLKTLTVANTNLLLGAQGCVAGKTGYTSMAGKCLAALYERDGRQVIAVVLKSETDDTLRTDMESVIDWVLK